MAKQKGHNGGFQGAGNSKHAEAKRVAQKKKTTNRILTVGAILVVLSLVTAGMQSVLGGSDQDGAAHAGSVQLDTSGAEVVSLEAGASLASVEHTATDRETRFLGPDNNPGGLSQAEAGQVGRPTLVWFHADW